jgi:predicted nucleotidyltransferase
LIDGHLPSLDRLPIHRKLLESAVARFQDDVRVVGLVVGGSLAHGAADFYSDVDLYIVVQDEGFDEIFAERGVSVEAVGSPLFGFDVDPMPGGSTDYIVIYEGPVKFDFMYLKESDLKPTPNWVGCLVLKDLSGPVGAVVARSQGLAPPQPTTEELLDLNQKFWTWCWYAFGKIERGELWETLDGIHTIRSIALTPLLDWAAERPHEGYRRLERKTDPEAASRLMATVALVQSEALYAALQAEMVLFRSLRAMVFERYGLTFDPRPEEMLESEMRRRWTAQEAQ